jgi:hypothetical protein
MASPYSIGEKFNKQELSAPMESNVPVTLHEHKADKAGLHYDLRIGGKGDWAIRHFPKSPGERRLAVRQPTHPLDYYGFSGSIKSGYGKGSVKIKYKGTGTVHSWSDSKITVSFGGKTYALIHTGGDNWIILMKTKALEKKSFHVGNTDTRIRSALRLEGFGKEINGIAGRLRKRWRKKRPVKDERKRGNVSRAENPLIVNDVELNKGPRTRAYRDLLTGKIRSDSN